MPGSARSCSQIHSRYGSSFDTADGREYLGGATAVNARRTVLRCNPVRLLISRIDSRSTRCMRLISAHCSTPTTPSSPPDHTDQARVRTRPDEPDPTPGGPLFDRRRWTTIHPAPTKVIDDLIDLVLRPQLPTRALISPAARPPCARRARAPSPWLWPEPGAADASWADHSTAA